MNDLQALARTLYGEARGEGRSGMEAVACVVLNRAARPRRFGATVAEVCLRPWQFSCWNPGDPNLPKLRAVTERDPSFRDCLAVAFDALAGRLADRTGGADHYHTRAVAPSWSRGQTPTATIGNHLFFRLP